ncbi:MAG: CPBP family intramembrane metalloprotease [Dehalococcoidia bacterium]|nr:CPBP family intramembrane metalloprotease [Dehalococcoidia bacterium]MDD5493491.1 CPBP family intramembrane metalloprotease [Dehalococcoidia bacterium]
MSLRTRKILLFLGLTFLINYSMVYVYLALGGKFDNIGIALLGVAYMLVPMTVAIIVQKAIFKETLAAPLGISFKINSWFFFAWFLPPLIAVATMGVSLLFPGITFTPDMSGFFNSLQGTLTPEQIELMKKQLVDITVHPFWLMLIQGLIAGTTINAVFAFGEELGWRGLLQKELNFLGFWKSSALIGLIWGIWHAPLILQGFNYPQHPQIGVLMMTGWTIIMAPLFSYIRLKSQSVIAASIFHGTINATAGLSVLLISGGDDLLVGITGLAGFIVFGIANIGLFVYDRFVTKEPVNEIIKNMEISKSGG